MTMTEQMFVCRANPETPGQDGSDAELGVYIVRLALAHEDCKRQLGTVRNHLKVNGVVITDIANSPATAKSGSKYIF